MRAVRASCVVTQRQYLTASPAEPSSDRLDTKVIKAGFDACAVEKFIFQHECTVSPKNMQTLHISAD